MVYVQNEKEKISKIALGTADFGTTVSEKDAFLLLDRFIENGGTTVDTARAYSYWLEGGENASETTIGNYFKATGKRHKVFLSTKGGHPPIPHFEISRINKEELTKDIDESLHFLNTDYLDVFYLHRDDENKPVGEIMEILDGFVKAGKTRYIGASNWKKERVSEANQYAKERHLTPFTFSQVMWAYARMNEKTMPDKTQVVMNDGEHAFYNEHKEIQVMAYSSQAQGFFSLVEKCGLDGLPEMHTMRYLTKENVDKIPVVFDTAKRFSISPTAAGLALLLADEVNPIALVGGQTLAFLEDSFNALRYFQK